jgi:RNA polymerase sigma factor (sigma-70 family)
MNDFPLTNESLDCDNNKPTMYIAGNRLIDVLDENVWKQFLKGDTAAFKMLMEENYRVLFNYGSKISTDNNVIKDCIQDLFLNLWNKKNNLSPDVNPKAYLIASLRRIIFRKIKSKNKAEIYGDVDSKVFAFNLEVSVEEELIQSEFNKELARKIAGHIGVLPKRQKEVIYLKFFAGMSREEIAEAMNISHQTVSNITQMAIKRLRVDMKEIIQFKI